MKQAIVFLAVIFFGFSASAQEKKLQVVASFSILGDIVHEIAGDKVDLKVLVGPNADTHVYQPTPSDMKAIAGADIVVVNGLEFEGWLSRLLKSTDYKGVLVVASDGIAPLKMGGVDHSHHHHSYDPHAWQTAKNGIHYVDNIRKSLIHADAKNAKIYARNAAVLSEKLKALDSSIRAQIKEIPANQRKVITSHDAFGHFAHEYGVEFISPMGVSTESEATAKDIATLIDQIRANKVRALFVENISDKRLIEQLSAEAGAVLGGTLYSDALSAPDGAGGSYYKMLENNAKLLIAGMRANVDNSPKPR